MQIGKVTDTPVVDENGNLTESAKAAIEVLEQYAKTFQERNPNLYLFNCVMHLDEATPHLHMDYIPVAHGYKTGLKTRNSLTKAFQEMGFTKAVSKKENETIAWQQRERNYLTELCREHGIEVELLGVQRENLSLPEYKVAMQKVAVLEQQAEELHAQIEELEEKERKNQEILLKYDLRAKDLKSISEEAEMENKKVKSMALAVNNFFGSEEYVKVKKSDWNKITDIFKRSISRNFLLETYEKKICGLEKKVSKLTGQIERRIQFIASKDLEQAYVEFEKSLQPKTFKQKLEEKKEDVFKQNQKRNMEKQEITNKKRFQRE